MHQEDIDIILTRLIQTCKEGDYGFRRCAVHVQGAELKAVLLARGDECARAAQELVTLARQTGAHWSELLTRRAAAPNGWSAVKGMLAGYDDMALLEECQRGERNALDIYAGAVDAELPPPLRALVRQQYAAIERSHDCLRTLRWSKHQLPLQTD